MKTQTLTQPKCRVVGITNLNKVQNLCLQAYFPYSLSTKGSLKEIALWNNQASRCIFQPSALWMENGVSYK